VIRLTFIYPDRDNLELTVLYSGHNPALVTLDEKRFYWAAQGKCGEGATEVLARLLGTFTE
jgi:hypothetical protein